MDEKSKTLWEKVCATVNKWGSPRSPRAPVDLAPSAASRLDLHGHTVHDAYYATRDFINRPDAPLVLTVITGKSGRIRTEFADWLWQFKRVKTYREINAGAFEIRLK